MHIVLTQNEMLTGAGVALLIVGIALRQMRPRHFYFVRHGETLLNAEHIRQGAEGALSTKGRAQAVQVGEALKGLSIRRIFSSTYPRAKETALILAQTLHARVTYTELLVERRNPSQIIGKSTLDPSVMHIVDEMDLAYHDDAYQFSDEETFLELKNRARKCLNMLANKGGYATTVVTHHVMLKMLVAYAGYREHLHAQDFIKLTFFNFSDNAGITILEYHPWKAFSATRGWVVTGYNQRAN